ncbi:MAG: SDR family NAD(P)-dependent oxidoreductase [Sterolibacterium sp.]|nr:SDR family NAD(P)-dependent oxidoreductase [Sterolibacterium sp.]
MGPLTEQSSAQLAEDIAVIGMAFRFPGDLADEESLWNALKDGRDLVSQVPSDRWAVDELQHPKRAELGRSISFSAGVLSRIDEFDAGFFGISPREAAWLDPQQRLLLELAWESMENAGCVPSSLAGSDCAVYVGISSLDYGTRGLDDLASLSSHSMTGNTLSIAANRLSYIFDLYGPSLAVDTACSSSLVALHHACNSLRTGEASTALVGGVNLLLHPYPFVGFTKASMLSADGHCKAFDASGDGYVRAEGGAVLFLKPITKALADGDNIHAIIRATGVNADGARKTGITIPSRDGQAELMRIVLAKSGLQPEDIDFIEAHGTGTAVGDPIEAAAIGSVYGQCRSKDRPLPIGSVKTNLGHLEPASGMAGLVKALLALKHRAIPPSLHFVTPNPHIDFSGLNLEVVTQYTELRKSDDKPLVAGVNSFGFGGANAHVLIQEFHQTEAQSSLPLELPLPPLFLSARTLPALRAMAGRYAELLSEKTPEDFYDITFAAAHRREFLEKRLALKVDTAADAAERLARFAQSEAVEQIVSEDGLPQPGGVAFVYSGNGAQWVGMGQKLMVESERFAAIVADLDAVMLPVAGFSIIHELQAEEPASRIQDTVVAQPLLFVIQVAVTTLLKEQGIQPAAVIGHSVGEVAAAWAAGVLDLDQAIRVICARSAAQGLTRGTGRMAAVGLSETAMHSVLEELGDELDVEIAGINSPDNVTISGNLDDLERIGAHLEHRGVFFRLLDLDYAFHSRQMDPIEARFAQNLADLAPVSSSKAAFVSTVTGDVLDGTALGAGYWWRNVRHPVRFADAMAKLVDLGCRVFIEIGPHAILQRYIGECLKAANVQGRVLSSLRKDDDGIQRLQEAALRVHLLAETPRLGVYFPVSARHVDLPNYPWQRERHWHPVTSESHLVIEHRRVHPLLGWRLQDTDFGWENTLDPVTLPWLADHQVGGAIVLPGAAYAEMALAAAREWQGSEALALEELDILSPIVFDGEHARTLRFSLNPRDGGFQIKSSQRLSADEWTLHAVGRVIEATVRPAEAKISAVPSSSRVIDRATHYRLATLLGLGYGPVFQGLLHACVHGDRLEAALDLPESVTAQPGYLLHPALLDVCYQSLVDFFQDEIEAGQGVPLLPVRLGRLSLLGNAPITQFRARLLHRAARSVLADFELLDAQGNLVVLASGCRFRAAHLQHRNRPQVGCWQITPWLQPHPTEGLATEIVPTTELAKRLYARFAENEASLKRQVWFMETLPLFEALTLSFAFEAFRTLFNQRPEWMQQALAHRVALPYLQWLVNCLQQENLLVERDGFWRLEGNVPAADEIWQAILRDAPACLPQLVLLGRVGCHLPGLLSGETDSQRFLETLSHSPSVESLQEDDPVYLGTRLGVQQTLLGLAADWPAHRRLRILEVTSGTSELPRAIHAVLAEDRLDYVLALPDEDMRQRSQAEYHDFANITVAGVSFTEWKFAADKPLPEVFDVVVLRHALHRAVSPQAALAQTKRWLACGGVLLIAERYPDWSADLVGGLDPAWWHRGEENQFLSSLMAPAAWEGALREEGFDEVELVTEPTVDGLAEGAYLLLSKRSAEDIIVLSQPQPAVWLLLTDAASDSMADQLRRRLEAQDQHVVTGEMSSAQDRFDHVVYLRGWRADADEALDLPADLLQRLQALVAGHGKMPRLWILTQGGVLAAELPAATSCPAPNPVQAALWGLGRVVMNEYPTLSCTLIDLACEPSAADTLARLENELLRPDGINEIVLAPDARYSLVMREDVPKTSAPATDIDRYRLDFRVPGQLRNLLWLPETKRPLQDHEIEVRTHATGLNFRDVMYLMGLLPDEAVENGFAGASLGLEFSGVVDRVGVRVRDYAPGDAVMGFGAACFASHVVTRADAVAPLPEGWSFEAAATVPTVFFTVYYALKHLADLQPGERVLIHGAAGGVGLAAIQFARHLGAEIFATAGSDEKRDFVRLLGADHVFDSRNLAFADDILAVTSGEGVDVVLNSLAGEAIRRNLRVLKPFGRFLELGKRDFFENTPIGLRPFKDNISYFGIDADQLLTGRPALAARLFREVMALFREGVLSPLPWRAFPATRVVDAFRVMQQARHIGKVVVSLADAAPQIERQAEPLPVLRFEQDSTWLVTGGLSGFGLESARWLAAREVGHLVLIGRRGLETPGAQEAIENLQAGGVTVQVVACDITDRLALGIAFERIRKTLPPLKGVLHAAAAFDDALIVNLDAVRMDGVLRPKLLGAWNLHQLTVDIPLDHFVLYSSVTTFIGNPGQANYVAANAGLEGLAAMRHAMGLPATCIGWGPIGDAGYLSRNEAIKDGLAQRLGRAPLTAAEALDQLDRLLNPDSGSRAVANFEWSVLSRLLPSATSARFTALNRNVKDGGTAEDSIDFRVLIAGKSVAEVTDIVRKLVTQEVAQILSISPERIEPGRSLHDLGMDSLMAVELALGLEQRFGIQLPVMMLNESPTAERVTTRIVEKLLGGTDEAVSLAGAIDSVVESIAKQHGEAISREEVERMAEDARTLAQNGARLIA